MTESLYEAAVIAVVGVIILVSIVRFIKIFYSNSQKGVQLIRLSKNAYIYFIFFLSMNFIFLIGFLLQIFNTVNNSDLIAILIYAIGTSIFFFSLASIISKKYKFN